MKKITVLETRVISQGEKDGNKWELSVVKANDEAGKPITATLKTFAKLPVGVPIEVEVEVKNHETYGTSYMLKLPKLQGGAAAGAIAELRGRVERLESEVKRLSSSPASAPGPVGPPAPSTPAYAGIPDEEIPF